MEGQETNQITGEIKKSGTAQEYLRIDDTGIKYMLVNAIKEQQEMIEELRKANEELRSVVEELASTVATNQESEISASLEGKSASLEQNTPNPFHGQTSLKYFIPENAQSAKIVITSSNGQVIKTVNIQDKGDGVLNLSASDMPTGNYHYTLSVDGRLVETKTMSLTR